MISKMVTMMGMFVILTGCNFTSKPAYKPFIEPDRCENDSTYPFSWEMMDTSSFKKIVVDTARYYTAYYTNTDYSRTINKTNDGVYMIKWDTVRSDDTNANILIIDMMGDKWIVEQVVKVAGPSNTFHMDIVDGLPSWSYIDTFSLKKYDLVVPTTIAIKKWTGTNPGESLNDLNWNSQK